MTGASPAPCRDALAPFRLTDDRRLSPDQFAAVCIANPEAVLELSAEGHLIHMTPTGGETGARNSRLLMRLLAWADRVGGWRVFDSSTGFRLPVSARLLRRRWLGAQHRGLTALRRKMAAYQANGAQIWSNEANGEPQRLVGANALEAGEGFPGQKLKFAEIWEA
ncbi:MAG: Uma2 family endonuclease [Cyanobium sp. CZS 25K]|nr:Uma2 family endonuclease [Cyanobium sp. CZS25K]